MNGFEGVYTHTQHGIAKTWSKVEGNVKENDREYANVYMIWEGKHPPRFNRKRKPRAGRTLHPIQMPQATTIFRYEREIERIVVYARR